MSAKLYYSISEVSKIADEEQHILRYWEKEFALLKPRKNRAGNRIYSAKDIKIVKTIKKLLRQDKLSLKGAKERLASMVDGNEISDASASADMRSIVSDSNDLKTEPEGITTAESGSSMADRALNIISKSEMYDIINLLKQVSAKLKQ